MADYVIRKLEEIPDVLGDYPGEMRMATPEMGNEQVAFTHRRMPPDTGGKGSYGHHHKTQGGDLLRGVRHPYLQARRRSGGGGPGNDNPDTAARRAFGPQRDRRGRRARDGVGEGRRPAGRGPPDRRLLAGIVLSPRSAVSGTQDPPP